MRNAIHASAVAGVEHNLRYLSGIMDTPEFVSGEYTTGLADICHDKAIEVDKEQFAFWAATYLHANHKSIAPQDAGISIQLRQGKLKFDVRLNDDSSLAVGREIQAEQADSAESMSTGTVNGVIRSDIASQQAAWCDNATQRLPQVLHDEKFVYVMWGGHTEKFKRA